MAHVITVHEHPSDNEEERTTYFVDIRGSKAENGMCLAYSGLLLSSVSVRGCEVWSVSSVSSEVLLSSVASC